MRFIQFTDENGGRALAATTEGGPARRVRGFPTLYALARQAIIDRVGLAERVAPLLTDEVDAAAILASGRMLPPIDHPDPTHLHVTGTGLTHRGSAATRDAMHQTPSAAEAEKLTDSMKMFRMGLEGGKPAPGAVGVQPEWFYKGNGFSVVRPDAPIISPAFADDAGEEPEIAGIYLIGDGGVPFRIGFALGNEFSDHVMERVNYLYLAHSKLRACSFGPEIRTGELPAAIEGRSRIVRGGQVVWEKPFLSGEDNMSHTIANLEHHHFKYRLFRQPGDVHVHMFGTATLSFADGIRTEPGDVFEIEESQFGLPLRNSVAWDRDVPVTVRQL